MISCLQKYGMLVAGMIAVMTLAGACGDKVEVQEAAELGNAVLVFDSVKDVAVADQEITFNRLRVWLSSNNSNHPGDATIVDEYTVEVWATLASESGKRYAKITGLVDYGDGNLYYRGTEPGTTVYTQANTGGNWLPKSGVYGYTITAEDGLVTNSFNVNLYNQDAIADGTSTVTRSELVNVKDIDATGWVNVVNRTVTPVFTRNTLVKNASMSTKGRMACLYKTADDSGNQSTARAFYSGEVELGNVFMDEEGVYNSNATDAGTSLADDDVVYIAWNENWYVTGVDVQTRTLRTYRGRSAPIYNSRELPGVDTSDAEPKPSGIESLVRTCNSKAAKNGGAFTLVSLSNSAAAPAVVTSADDTAFCASLNTALADADLTKALDLSSANWGCGGGWAGAGTVIGQGNWNGTAHSGAIHSTALGGTALYHVAQTAITASAF